jgi:hypothetical protein
MVRCVMTVLRNNFEGGPHGTVISTSNSGQYGDNAFNAVDSVGTGQVNQFTSVDVAGLNRPTAEFVYEISTGSTINTPWVQWSTSMGSQTQIWTRFYVYFATLSTTPSNNINLFTVGSTFGYDIVSVSVRSTTSPFYFRIVNEWAGTGTTLGTVSVTAGKWHRIEFRATIGGTGSADLFYYGEDAVDSPDYTDSVSQSGQDYGTDPADRFRLGQSVIGLANLPTTRFSNWELNNTGYPGPAPFRAGRGVPAGNMTNPIAPHCGIS